MAARLGACRSQARYAHTNLIADDWRALAGFYEDVFGCEPLVPERDLRGAWIDAGTGIEDAHIRGVHLRLPGHGPDGPTLEVFQYAEHAERPPTAVHRPGFGHICFAVDDVESTRNGAHPTGEADAGLYLVCGRPKRSCSLPSLSLPRPSMIPVRSSVRPAEPKSVWRARLYSRFAGA